MNDGKSVQRPVRSPDYSIKTSRASGFFYGEINPRQPKSEPLFRKNIVVGISALLDKVSYNQPTNQLTVPIVVGFARTPRQKRDSLLTPSLTSVAP